MGGGVYLAYTFRLQFLIWEVRTENKHDLEIEITREAA